MEPSQAIEPVIDDSVSPAPPAPEPSGPGQRPPPSFIYAIGRIEPRFPTLAVEKEFAQVLGRADAQGLADRQAMESVLGDPSNRYLARQLCWVFVIEGLETYILIPRDPADLSLLIEAIRSEPARDDVDVVIGTRGPLASPETCNGLVVPVVAFDQIYSFNRTALIESIPIPDDVKGKQAEGFRVSAGEVFDRVMQVADNAGATDEHRALNYLVVRYPAIYAKTAEAHQSNFSLTAVDVHLSRLAGARVVVNVILSYTHRQTDVVEKHFVRTDVTEEFPFLVTKLSPYISR
jgi:PatG C-terminal